MAAEHEPPPGGGAAGEPASSAGDAGTAREESAAAQATSPAGDAPVARPNAAHGAAGTTTRGRRLLPSGPALEHAPLLLGLDAAGGEHPQGPGHEDDEDLVGRAWGCVCGWRGTVRDVSTRPFHPRVGDGGGLRRQRLARSDRDARGELEAHLSISAAPADLPSRSPDLLPAAAAATPSGPAAPGRAGPPRARGRRRRLTVHRDTPPAIAPAAGAAAQRACVDNDEPHAPTAEGAGRELPDRPADPSSTPASSGPAQEIRAIPAVSIPLEPTTSTGPHGAGERGTAEALADAAAHAKAARADLIDAETALDAAVAAACDDGLSWRSIGRATGLGHREAALRWGPPGGGPSL